MNAQSAECTSGVWGVIRLHLSNILSQIWCYGKRWFSVQVLEKKTTPVLSTPKYQPVLLWPSRTPLSLCKGQGDVW